MKKLIALLILSALINGCEDMKMDRKVGSKSVLFFDAQ